LLKYIGGLHSYLRHTILMFNPKKMDEFCVHETHLEARGINVSEETSEKSFKHGEKWKLKFKDKHKKNVTCNKEGEKITCKHCSKEGHDEDHYWKLHLEMRPKSFNNKEKEKIVATIQQDLGFDSRDDIIITTMGFKGKDIAGTSSSNYLNDTQYEKIRIELFHIRVISKHTKIDILFDIGSQENLNS